MTTTKTKTATVAAVAVTLVAAMLAYSAMVLPASAQTAATSSASTSASNNNITVPPTQWAGAQGQGGRPGQFQGGFSGGFQGGQQRGGPGRAPEQQANLTVGQTITVTSTQGRYSVVGDANDTGTASGTVTFTVTGKLSAGYTLSMTQGSVAVNGTTYTISSGSAQMGAAATALTGQGATSPAGQFIIQAEAHGSFAGSTATMSLDLGAGTTEYLVTLAGTVEG